MCFHVCKCKTCTTFAFRLLTSISISKHLGVQIKACTPGRASPTSSITFPGQISLLWPLPLLYFPFNAQITGRRTSKHPWKRSNEKDLVFSTMTPDDTHSRRQMGENSFKSQGWIKQWTAQQFLCKTATENGSFAVRDLLLLRLFKFNVNSHFIEKNIFIFIHF